MRWHVMAASLVAALWMAGSVTRLPPAAAPVADARIYAALAMGLAEHGVLGQYVDPAKAPLASLEVTRFTRCFSPA